MPTLKPGTVYGKGFSGHLGYRVPAPTINHTLTPTNVTGQLGATVYLHCFVHNAGQKTVSSSAIGSWEAANPL